MEFIKVAKVEHVVLLHAGNPFPGTLHITPHHLIFKRKIVPEQDASLPKTAPEIWVTYPIINTVERRCIGSYVTTSPSSNNKDPEATPTSGTFDNGALERKGLSRESSNVSEESAVSATEAQKRLQALAIRLRCRDFTFITFCFDTEQEAKDVFDSIKRLTCGGSVERLYAFIYKPTKFEAPYNGWNLYDAQKEFERQGITDDWRVSTINSSYTFCDTYPAKLFIPTTISDNTLNYVAKFRSRQRVPVLTYIHSVNNCTLTRCAQPLTGLQKNRSVQDEKLIHAIFKSSNASGYASLGISSPEATSSSQSLVNVEQGAKLIYGAQQTNLIVDARPSVNAYAQQATGAGSEVMDNYKFAKKEYLGIDNIHVMRKSLDRVLEAIKDSDITPFPANRDLLVKSNWLRHINALLEGTNVIVRQVALEHSHVLIHCSDGWDRTSQLSALAQICLDPYFRTLDGFMVLVEKDWVSFGYKFRDRGGFLGSDKWFSQPADSGSSGQGGGSGFEQALGAAKMFFNQQASNFMGGDDDSDPEGLDSPTPRSGGKGKKDKGINIRETSPVFHQFLDATYQIMHQHPTRFEFNERFLRRLLYHMFSCQYGTFLYNCEKERVDAKVAKRTRSVWDYFLARRQEWINPAFDKAADEDERGVGGRVLFPLTNNNNVRWWPEIFGRTNEEMNGRASIFGRSGEPSPMRAAAPASPSVSRQSPVVVAEDAKGRLSSQSLSSGSGAAITPLTDDDIAKSAAVLGTERATALAEGTDITQENREEGDSVIIDNPELQERLEGLSNCATVASSTTLDMSESVQINESDSRMSSPPVISLDATPEKQERQQLLEEEPVSISIDGNSDPLGGHEAVDVMLSPSPRAPGRSIGGIGARFSRSRTPRSEDKRPVSKGLEELELV
ncbi:Myotubularin [Dactylellina cionopaga]|nr:Myotubularin [Dactylellina cionopaga]